MLSSKDAEYLSSEFVTATILRNIGELWEYVTVEETTTGQKLKLTRKDGTTVDYVELVKRVPV